MKAPFNFLSIAVLWAFCGVGLLGAQETNSVTVFDERFADNPTQRFKILPVTDSPATEGRIKFDEEKHTYSIEGYLTVLRPVRAVSGVNLDLTLEFEPLGTNASAWANTAFKFVLLNRLIAGVEIQRRTTNSQPAVTVKLVEDNPGRAQSRILREVSINGAALDGAWQLTYHDGLLSLRKGSNLVASADTGVPGAEVAGVSWTQRGGKVTCRRMTLSGPQFLEVDPGHD